MSLLLNNNTINNVTYNNNVGYTIIGSPTIVDGIASGFVNGQNFLHTDADTFSVANFNNCEFFWRCSTGNNALPVFSIGSNQGLWIDILQSTKKLRVKIGDINYYDFDLPSSFNTNDYFNYKLVFNNYKCSFYFGSDDLTFISEHQFETPTNLSYNNIIRIGSESWNWTSGTIWNGYIDLNNTYVKINNITWFNGKEQTSIDVDYLALNNDIIWIKNPFNKPASWPDIRENLIPNSIRLLADNRYPLGFTANAIGGYTVKIDGELKGTYASGAKCSIPQTDWPLGHIDSLTAYGATEQSGTPTPTTPQDIVCNNGVLKYGAIGKNLFNVSANPLEQGGIASADGQDALTSYNQRVRTNGYVPVKPNTVYTASVKDLQIYYLEYAQDKTYTDIHSSSFSNNSVTITTGENTYFIRLQLRKYDNSNITPSEVTNVQLERGSTATEYEPYQTGIYTDGTVETITDNLSNTATTEMLLKVGDYQDTQEVVAGSVTRNVGIKVLDGTESWSYSSSYSRFVTIIPDMPATAARTLPFISTHYQVTYGATTDPGYIYNSGSSQRQIMITDAHTSVEDWTQWLADQYSAGTPVIIVYPLAESTTETVTPQALTGTTATVTAGSINNLQITYTNAESGYPIDYPTGAETAHIIDIYPATEGNNITDFHCARVAVSGREAQGILWAHFNIDNEINLGSSFASYNSYYEPLMLSMTAKNNVIKCNKLPMFGQSSDLAAYADNIEYLPIFDLNNNTINGAAGSFNLLTTAELEKVILKNGTITGSFNSLAYNATKLKKINTKNVVLQPTLCNNAFQNNQSIEEIPDIDFTNATNLINLITNAVALKDTVLDTRAGTGITKIGCYGTSQYFMSGFKGLRVSNEAPFNNATPPQINVSYTGMDRNALVQLFNDLPTVNAGQIINIVGTTGTGDLTAEDEAIATAKGWTITK